MYIKDLPKIYQNKIGNINNNREVFYDNINNTDIDAKGKEKKDNIDLDIDSKIINIFKNSKNVYKVKVEITLKNRVITKYIVGRLPGKVITLDNESIPLEDIIDIRAVD